MEKTINDSNIEPLLLCSQRLFNIKYCINILENHIEDDGLHESNLELVSLFKIFKEYLLTTINIYHNLENKIDIDE